MKRPVLTSAAKEVLNARYLRKDSNGKVIENPKDLFLRVSKNIASAENKYGAREEEYYDTFYNMMMDLEFLPSSPILFNAGMPLQQLSACFVLPVDDTLSNNETGILDSQKHAALIHKTGGGTGFDFSRVRPEGVLVTDTSGVASGPVSFIRMFNATTNEIKSGGKRRGANIGILRVDHPDIFKFLESKEEEGNIENFNLSVAITDEFMRAVDSNSSFLLRWPCTGASIGVEKTVFARTLWDKIVDGAYTNGEPGILFIDSANKCNPVPSLGRLEATNPCGELWLLPFESCNLGSINVSKLYDGKSQSKINYGKFEILIKNSVRFLDNVIDMNKFPLPIIEKTTTELRRIGLGIMGFADLLIKMEITYGSDTSFKIAEKLISFLRKHAYEYSIFLAKERGSFPYLTNEPELSAVYNKGLRNVTVLSIAPTGTISLIANCSSGIEPVFSFELEKNIIDKTLDCNHKLYMEFKEAYPEKQIPEYFIEAGNIPYQQHVKMQSIFQRYVDSSISKTINFPETATKEAIANSYKLAWEQGCKGLTVYRDGSRNKQVLVATKDGIGSSVPLNARPRRLVGFTEKMKTGEGSSYITVNGQDGRLFELFVRVGKSGANTSANSEAIGRLISLCFRAGVDIKDIIKQLQGIGGSTPLFDNGKLVLSIPDAIAHVLSSYIGIGYDSEVTNADICPECHNSTLVREDGCYICKRCGYTKC